MLTTKRVPLSPILATSTFRCLDSISRAVKLVEDEKLSKQQAASMCGIDRSKLRRALIAKENQRPIAVNGRPPIFSAAQEQHFGQKLLERKASGDQMTHEKCSELVRTFLLMFSPQKADTSLFFLLVSRLMLFSVPRQAKIWLLLAQPTPTLGSNLA
jgi:hypothetical protein